MLAQKTNGTDGSDATPAQEPQPLTLGGAGGRTSSAPPGTVDGMASAMPRSVSFPTMLRAPSSCGSYLYAQRCLSSCTHVRRKGQSQLPSRRPLPYSSLRPLHVCEGSLLPSVRAVMQCMMKCRPLRTAASPLGSCVAPPQRLLPSSHLSRRYPTLQPRCSIIKSCVFQSPGINFGQSPHEKMGLHRSHLQNPTERADLRRRRLAGRKGQAHGRGT